MERDYKGHLLNFLSAVHQFLHHTISLNFSLPFYRSVFYCAFSLKAHLFVWYGQLKCISFNFFLFVKKKIKMWLFSNVLFKYLSILQKKKNQHFFSIICLSHAFLGQDRGRNASTKRED